MDDDNNFNCDKDYFTKSGDFDEKLSLNQIGQENSPENPTTSEDDDDLDKDQNYVPDNLVESEETDDKDEETSFDN